MKFYGNDNNELKIMNILDSTNSREELRIKLEEKRFNDAYEDFLKLASFSEISLNFDNVKDAMKTLALNGCNSALAYYLFNVGKLDEDVREYASKFEEHGNKENPEILKIIAGLHLHDMIDVGNEKFSIKTLIDKMHLNDGYLFSMSRSIESLGFYLKSIEELKIIQHKFDKIFNNTVYVKNLINAQSAYLNAYKDSKSPMDAYEFLNLRYFVDGALRISYPKPCHTLTIEKKNKNDVITDSYDIKVQLYKFLNRSLKNSEVNGEYYLPYAFAYNSLVYKDDAMLGLHSKSILKNISKLPLKTHGIKIGKDKTKA